MARLAFIDKTGNLCSTAWTCLKEGHDVVYWIEDKSKIGNGLIPKVNSEKEVVDFHPDVVYVYQDPHRVVSLTGKDLTAYGSSLLASKLEDERLYATSLCERYGIKVSSTFLFNSAKEAYDFLDTQEGKTRKGWVFKTNGKGSVASTHVTESDEHLRAVLDFESHFKEIKSFILQERVEGIEVSIEGWFDYRLPSGSQWIMPINSTIERKRLMSGNVGSMTGCMYSVVWAWPGLQPKLFRQTLLKMTPHLVKIKYVGPIDGNFIIDYKTRTPYFLEWTSRLGWNAFEAFMYGLDKPGTVGELLVSLGTGVLHNYKLSNTYFGAVRLYAPMCPDLPIFAPLDSDKRLFPKDVYLDDDKQLRAVGLEAVCGLSVIMEAVAGGSTVKEASREIYEDVIPQVVTTDLAYRDDMECIAKDIELLEAWGYITKSDKPTHDYHRGFVSVEDSQEAQANPDQDTPTTESQPDIQTSSLTGLV